jgi:hypothetical protein
MNHGLNTIIIPSKHNSRSRLVVAGFFADLGFTNLNSL